MAVLTPKEAFGEGTAVITGAGSGIGEGLAKHLAELGMNVVIAEIYPDRGNAIVKEIRDAGGEAIFVQTDVAEQSSLENLAEVAHSTYGDVRLLINNASVGTFGSILDTSSEDWSRVIQTNLGGTIHGIRAFLPRMLKASGPSYIANVASTAVFATVSGNAPYTTTKCAQLALTECLHMEMQEQSNSINVSIVLPGVVATRFIDDSSVANDEAIEARSMLSGLMAQSMSIEVSAQNIVEGIAAQKFWVSTHPAFMGRMMKSRADQLVNQADPQRPTEPFGATD